MQSTQRIEDQKLRRLSGKFFHLCRSSRIVTIIIFLFVVGAVPLAEQFFTSSRVSKVSGTNETSSPADDSRESIQSPKKVDGPNPASDKGDKGDIPSKTYFEDLSLESYLSALKNSIVMDKIESFSIILAAAFFLMGTRDRKIQLEGQAWQMIDGAQGSETSGARKRAIEYLKRSNADLTGLDADGADLRGIDLSYVNLTDASFKNADLRGADFSGSTLTHACFSGAHLEGVNFSGAEMTGAKLSKSRLGEFSQEGRKRKSTTNLTGAKLALADFSGADICEIEVSEKRKTILKNAKFYNSRLYSNFPCESLQLEKAVFVGVTLNGKEEDFWQFVENNYDYFKGSEFSKEFIEVSRQKGYEFRESKALNHSEARSIENRMRIVKILQEVKEIFFSDHHQDATPETFDRLSLLLEELLSTPESFNASSSDAIATIHTLHDKSQELKEIGKTCTEFSKNIDERRNEMKKIKERNGI